ncbi:MAG: hypothetical protein JOZ43_05365, partial [Acidobacteriales bacterium]|nr:hypothetical protein [Terriglobales bacterium]
MSTAPAHAPAPHHEHERHALMSTSIAIIMAVVAMLGAVVAFRAASAEQETTRVERMVQHGVMLEIARRQDYLSRLDHYETFTARSTSLHANAERDLEHAQKDPSRAGLFSLSAQLDFALIGVLQPYRDYFYVNTGASLEQGLRSRTAADLREYGFNTKWQQPKESTPKTARLPSIWSNLQSQVEHWRSKVIILSASVVAFVIALCCFTFAQLNHQQPLREKLLLRTGIAFAAAAFIVAALIDVFVGDYARQRALVPAAVVALFALALCWFTLERVKHEQQHEPLNPWIGVLISCAGFLVTYLEGLQSAWMLFLPLAGFGALAQFGRKLSERFRFGANEEDEPIHPAEVEPTLFAGMRLHTAPVAHRFGRTIIAMIAITAVLSAISGFLYSRSASKSAEYAGEALENQSEMFQERSRTGTAFFKAAEELSTIQEVMVRYEAAMQRR